MTYGDTLDDTGGSSSPAVSENFQLMAKFCNMEKNGLKY